MALSAAVMALSMLSLGNFFVKQKGHLIWAKDLINKLKTIFQTLDM